MKLTPTDLKKLASLAMEAAENAGTFIAKTRPQHIEHKGNGGSLATEVVTEVDRQSQDMILHILDPSFVEYDLALLTEECPDDGSRLIKDYFWCIDPIDGTLPFIEGIPGYAVSIALISREGIPQIGVVYDPCKRMLYHAIKDQGAFQNSAPWRLRDPGSLLQVFTDRSESEKAGFNPMLQALGAELGACGGAVMNALWALENPPACYFKFPKSENGGGCFWDFAAIACIYRELGAWASDIHGKPLALNCPDSIYLNHCGILFATDAGLANQVLSLNT